MLYFIRTGKHLNLKDPGRFNEKIQWLKAFDHNELYTLLADKYRVKDYIISKIGAEYVIPTIGAWDSFDEIDFSELPDKFVLKCNHDSGGLVICTDKENLDIEACRKKINYSLRRNYFYQNREWAYKNISKKIFAEEFMEEPGVDGLNDYKFMVFNGKVQCVFTCTERYSQDGLKVTFFDPEWNELPFERHYKKSLVPIPKPHNLTKMISIAEQLAKGIPFVRVDLYEINKKVYFGEMTFYPGSGMEEFRPDEWDLKMGGLAEIIYNWLRFVEEHNEKG